MKICHLYISPGHNYFGHHEQPAGVHPIVEVAEIECVAGCGVKGDRFFNFKENYKGQITFFSREVFDSMCAVLKLCEKSPGAARRNVVTEGVDLNSLIGAMFEIQGVKFRGIAHCKPCHWMDHAFAPGAEQYLQNCGGLRAQILTGGRLCVDSCHEPLPRSDVSNNLTTIPPLPAGEGRGEGESFERQCTVHEEMKTLTAVLFAGGESRRMGSDKATLPFNGEPLWSRQIRILRELHPARVMVSARNKPEWCPAEIEVVLDEPPSRGPLSGLVSALEKIQTTHLLALAIDLPRITSAHLKKLWALARPGIGIIPQNDQLIEPLCAIYPVEGVGLALNALSKDDVSLSAFIQTLAAQNRVFFYGVTQSESSLYQNINTPEEWEQVKA